MAAAIMTVGAVLAAEPAAANAGVQTAGLSGPDEQAGRDAQQGRFACFREARFGMFVHWGPHSEMAGE